MATKYTKEQIDAVEAKVKDWLANNDNNSPKAQQVKDLWSQVQNEYNNQLQQQYASDILGEPTPADINKDIHNRNEQNLLNNGPKNTYEAGGLLGAKDSYGNPLKTGVDYYYNDIAQGYLPVGDEKGIPQSAYMRYNGSDFVQAPTKSNAEVANEVIRGQWGNGQQRKDSLTQSGYDYNAVQGIVNQRMPRPKTEDPETKTEETVPPTETIEATNPNPEVEVTNPIEETKIESNIDTTVQKAIAKYGNPTKIKELISKGYRLASDGTLIAPNGLFMKTLDDTGPNDIIDITNQKTETDITNTDSTVESTTNIDTRVQKAIAKYGDAAKIERLLQIGYTLDQDGNLVIPERYRTNTSK